MSLRADAIRRSDLPLGTQEIASLRSQRHKKKCSLLFEHHFSRSGFTQNESQTMDLHIGFLILFSALFLQNWRYPE
jgi:hypothetical protein